MPPSPSPVPASHAPGFSWSLALLLAGCGLILSLLVSVYWQAAASREALDDLQARSHHEDLLDAVYLPLLEAESSVRGYLLSNNPVYLGPYQESADHAREALATLRSALAGQPAFRARLLRLTDLVERKRAVLEQGLAHGARPEVRSASGGPGLQTMVEIRAIVGELRTELAAAHERRVLDSFASFSRSRMLNFALCLGALGLLLVLFVSMRKQERMRRQFDEVLRREKAELESQVARRTAELSALATYLTNTREAEQARLARELHDELGALLTAAKLDTGWIARKLPPEVKAPLQARFDRLQDTLNQGIAIKRRVVTDLRPPLLGELGLVDALNTYLDNNAGELQIETELPADLPELKAPVGLALFRIAQEALNNVHKHAGARKVRLRLSIEDEDVVLRIEDDGRGFDPATRTSGSHGLAGMRHRVQMFAGRLVLRSAPGRGTLVEARVPTRAALAA